MPKEKTKMNKDTPPKEEGINTKMKENISSKKPSIIKKDKKKDNAKEMSISSSKSIMKDENSSKNFKKMEKLKKREDLLALKKSKKSLKSEKSKAKIIKKEQSKMMGNHSKDDVKNKKIEKDNIKSAEHVIKITGKRNKKVLNVKNITKKFGSFVALNNISFSIEKGERVGLIGGNGAGKTTVSEIIAGINKPTSGVIEYGFEFNDSPKEGIGMQFQQSDYPSGLTVRDIIMFARNLRKLKISTDEMKKLLSIFQMENFYKRKVRSLSGGQRQKLNILLSIIHNPHLVILDELSTGLDISAREDIIEFTDKLLTENNMSAILISHHMAEIESLCSKVIILEQGKVVDIALISDIEKKHGSLSKYSKKIISESNIRLSEMEKSKNSKVHKGKLDKLLAQKENEKSLMELRLEELSKKGINDDVAKKDKKVISIENKIKKLNIAINDKLNKIIPEKKNVDSIGNNKNLSGNKKSEIDNKILDVSKVKYSIDKNKKTKSNQIKISKKNKSIDKKTKSKTRKSEGEVK